jgi:hypothetical protein
MGERPEPLGAEPGQAETSRVEKVENSFVCFCKVVVEVWGLKERY